MTAFYNEIDPYAAQWLRNLIAANLIAPGVVDERSIEDIKPNELLGFTQCHFFAGIGVWSFALRNAGWEDDRPVWTGSCPCQPFSSAGKGNGFDDERHLWPHFQWLIQQCKPPIVFGEQVASKDAEPWIDLVHADVEAMGYAFGCIPFPSAGVGAPHIRDRNYWVGYSERARLEGLTGHGNDSNESGRISSQSGRPVTQASSVVWMGNTNSESAGRNTRGAHSEKNCHGESSRNGDRFSDADGTLSVGLANCDGHRRDKKRERFASSKCDGVGRNDELLASEPEPGPTNGFWQSADWLHCRDGKWRPVEPGTFPLANGIANRVVCACTKCKTETVIYEGMYFLRKIPGWNKRCGQEEILRQKLLSIVQAVNAINKQEYSLLSSQNKGAEAVRKMQRNRASSGSSQGSEPIERQLGQPGNALLSLSPQGARERVAFDVRRMWSAVQGGVAPEPEQDLFCIVCEGVGSHQCLQEMDGKRVGRLRAYGNAINAEAAKVFIESVMECLPN